MFEEWRPVVGFEGFYEVSNLGRVRSVERNVTTLSGVRHYISRPINPLKLPNGYLEVRLRVEGSLTVSKLSRLVATAFIPNPDHLPEVNHKDENKENNRADNLEWCTRVYNVNYGTARERAARSNYNSGSPIYSIDSDGVIIEWSNKSRAAEAIGVNPGSISRALDGIPKNHVVRGLAFYQSESELKEQHREA